MCMPEEIAYDAQNITPAEINSTTFIPVVINYVQEAVVVGVGWLVEGKGGTAFVAIILSVARMC